jgi:hypothetical protein
MAPKLTTPERRGGGERRSGADRRKKPSRVPRRHGVTAVAGVAGTVSAWAASEISRRYNIPIEVTSPVVGLIFGTLAAVYNKVVLPWME